MAFDLATAKPIESGGGGFDLSTAKPADEVQLGEKEIPGNAGAAPAPSAQPGGLFPAADAASGAALSIASSIPAQLLGRLTAMGHLAIGGTSEDAARSGTGVANALTYQPRSAGGPGLLDRISNLISTSKIEGVGPMMPQGPAVSVPAVVAGRSVSPRVAAVGKAGMSVTPEEAGAGIVGRTAAGLSGEAKLSKKISNKNQPVLAEKIANDLELPKGTELDREVTEAVREGQGQAYEVVRKSGKVAVDDAFRTDLEAAVKDLRTAAEDFGHRKESPILKVVDSLAEKESFDANSAVSEIKNLRKDAKKAFRAGDEELGLGSLDVARALEDVLDRHIEKLSASNEYGGLQISPEAMGALKKARTMIAKSYAADKALRGNEINPQVYAKMLEDRMPLTGGAKEVGEFARDFPRSSQKPSHMAVGGPDWSDMIMALASGGKSLLKSAGLSLLRPAGREILASDLYQALQRTHGSAQAPIPSPAAAPVLSAAPIAASALERNRNRKK